MKGSNSMADEGTGAGLRLQAYLARCGVASRRAAEILILEGRVKVNGEVVSKLGSRALPADRVEFDGKLLGFESRFRYIALNKPEGYICSASDPQGRPLARDLIPGVDERIYNVGRLDLRSSGLILFTNDGDFAAKVGHPSASIEKEYVVDSTVPVSDDAIEAFKNGVEIEGELYRCSRIERTGRRSIRVVLIEGKNREIRKVFSHFHLHPERLLRVRIGPIFLGQLASGESRSITQDELRGLRALVEGAPSHGNRD
ncbi:MAG TPA: rRNA pseudouridine synthase [Treponema sp.]|nr:MAG: RNA pseudouridine synthase [Treponema sp. GWA1_62_8]OHE67093.1 MAG: RNA pseudouridine synthase [Treponema sp. GWC1_61_84]HCM26197.1 rRNA pseudouridine synthase [Treponema sp.]